LGGSYLEMSSITRYCRKDARYKGRRDEEEDVRGYWGTLRQREHIGIWWRSIRPRSLENSIRKRLLTCHKTDYAVNERRSSETQTTIIIIIIIIIVVVVVVIVMSCSGYAVATA